MSETSALTYTLVLIALPLASAMLACIIPARYHWLVAVVSSFLLLLTTLAASIVFFSSWNTPPILVEVDWFQVSERTISAGILLNAPTLVLVLVVSVISFLVHVFSIGYMTGDAGEQRYFATLGFFTFSMLGLVTASNLLQLFIFWELVGFSSYVLIGHWREKPEAASAAKKAFVINRVADLGFVAGLLLVWAATENFSLSALPLNEPDSWRTLASVCFLIGVLGKSAQFPFFNWLPSAMEGPTPVSALIHAATMVVAGVFLLIRIFPLFTSTALDVVALVGAGTALLGALAALHQFDIKKILAYSTISQVGFMLVAVGTGSPDVALLHLFTHAFFKAGLFLSAGAVIHSLHQTHHTLSTNSNGQDIRSLGGLRKGMPVTFIAFTVCAAALVGLPLFSGFQSKDAILTHLLRWQQEAWQLAIVFVMVCTVLLTVVYTFRLWWFTFMGDVNKRAFTSASEVPAIMRFPLLALAISSLWWVVYANPLGFHGWLLNGLHTPVVHNQYVAWGSAIVIPVTLLASWQWFQKRKPNNSLSIFSNGYFFDSLNEWLIAKPSVVLATAIERVDKRFIDGALHLAAYATTAVAYLTGWVDANLIDGTVNAAGRVSTVTGRVARSISNGKIQTYILWPVLALIVFLFWVLF
jgi:NADH-quinone oxidoreductase subunit L